MTNVSSKPGQGPTWRYNFLISNLIFIVGSQIILQKNVEGRRRLKIKQFIMVG
jgi:hypothetical protein